MSTIKSTKTNEEMAQVFYRTGLWFDSLPNESKVDMSVGTSDAEVGNCNTPACFGGWLSVMFGTELHYCNSPRLSRKCARSFKDGANKFAKELGFVNYIDLVSWAKEDQYCWGNDWGFLMFAFTIAFVEEGGYDHETPITIKDIANKLIAVAKRLDKDIETKFGKKDVATPKIVAHTKQKVC